MVVKTLKSALVDYLLSQRKSGIPLVEARLGATPAEIVRREPSRIILTGRNTYGIEAIQLRSWGEVAHLYVGSFCSIAPEQNVFVGGNHRTDWATTFPFGHAFRERFPAAVERAASNPTTKGHVVIENDVWIGLGCTIMSGVSIGSGSVIATKSVVTKDVPPYAIVGGNPAKLIRMRYPDAIVSRLLDLQWWSYSDQAINAIVPYLQMPLDEAVIDRIESGLRGSHPALPPTASG